MMIIMYDYSTYYFLFLFKKNIEYVEVLKIIKYFNYLYNRDITKKITKLLKYALK